MRFLLLIIFILAMLVTEIETRGDIAISKFNPKLTPRRLQQREKKRTRAKKRRMRKRAARKRRQRRLNTVFVVRGDFSRSGQ